MPVADASERGFRFIGKEQQWVRVPWPDAAKCYSLSPRERAGVRGKCTQCFHTRRSSCASFPLTLNPSPQRRGKPVIPPKQLFGSLAATVVITTLGKKPITSK